MRVFGGIGEREVAQVPCHRIERRETPTLLVACVRRECLARRHTDPRHRIELRQIGDRPGGDDVLRGLAVESRTPLFRREIELVDVDVDVVDELDHADRGRRALGDAQSVGLAHGEGLVLAIGSLVDGIGVDAGGGDTDGGDQR